jgi:hypothetical protein
MGPGADEEWRAEGRRDGPAGEEVMTAKPRRKSAPLLADGFTVRVDGRAGLIQFDESSGWSAFLNECRRGPLVELLKGKIVVARLEAKS